MEEHITLNNPPAGLRCYGLATPGAPVLDRRSPGIKSMSPITDSAHIHEHI
jgi:hypothetical protein